MIVCGCDVGASTIKMAVMEDEPPQVLFARSERIRKRNPADVVDVIFEQAASEGFRRDSYAYVASTGEGDAVREKDGHFYSMTCHARGARHFFAETRSVLDLGALHMRAIKLTERGRVDAYKMTSQCASGTGQFLDNIARYLGLTLDEIPQLSLQATNPQAPSTICAVLAETDVINLVSKGVPLSDIIRGIHEMVAQRAVRLLSTFNVESPLTLTGGLALDGGLVHALEMKLNFEGYPITTHTHEMSMYAGAIGAALWGGVRYRRIHS